MQMILSFVLVNEVVLNNITVYTVLNSESIGYQ